jgi:hypothetical protein
MSNPKLWSSPAAVICGVALVGCGSSQMPSRTTASGTSSRALEFANCMRAHGVPSLPDPSAGGGGVNLAGTGIDPQSPAFRSARQACGQLAPGGRGGPQATESQFLAALRFARCMRARGWPDFPDPTHSDSPPGPILVIGPGLYFRVSPTFDPNTPAVSAAVAACRGGRSVDMGPGFGDDPRRMSRAPTGPMLRRPPAALRLVVLALVPGAAWAGTAGTVAPTKAQRAAS